MSEGWRRLNRDTPDQARAELLACCGSSQWVDRMMGRRPFANAEALLAAAREEWFALAADDWREAFAHHPQIGDRNSLRARFPHTAHLSAREQEGVAGASDDTLDALAEANRIYQQRFGYIFILCATGKTADEMLALLRERLLNDPETEIRMAAAEQAKITELRLLRD